MSLPDGNTPEFSNLLLIEHLVHETSHLFLNSILAHDPLILNEEDKNYVSPIRSDLRPMLGIYHTSFVLSRVIRIFKKLKNLDLHDNQLLESAIKNLSDKYHQAYATTHAEGIHTELGKQILLSTGVRTGLILIQSPLVVGTTKDTDLNIILIHSIRPCCHIRPIVLIKAVFTF